jgi:hypothetical protein
MPTIQDKTSRWYYLLAPLIFVIACVLFGLILWSGLGSINRNLVRLIVPGKTVLHLAKAGSYTVFYEYESIVGGQVFSTGESLQEINCSAQMANSNMDVPLSRPSTRTSYKTGEASGFSVLEFQIKTPGNYDFACDYRAGQEGNQVVFAVGPGISTKIWLTVLLGIAVMFGGFTVALGVAIWTYLKRKMVKAQACPQPVQSAPCSGVGDQSNS